MVNGQKRKQTGLIEILKCVSVRNEPMIPTSYEQLLEEYKASLVELINKEDQSRLIK